MVPNGEDDEENCGKCSAASVFDTHIQLIAGASFVHY